MVLSNIDLIDTGAVESDGNDLRSQFERAIITVMNSVGYASGNPSVAWRVLNVDGSLFVAGILEGPNAIQACLEWAAVLGMTEYATDRDDDGREWVARFGPWRIELLGRSK